MATINTGSLKQNVVDTGVMIDSAHVHAITMGDIEFIDIDGNKVFVARGSSILVNLERMVACNEDGVHFAIYKDEFIPVTFN